jgi:hypothetical protein
LSEKKEKRQIMGVIPDILMIIGFFFIEYGLFTVYPPAMWVVGGILLILLGYPKKGVE